MIRIREGMVLRNMEIATLEHAVTIVSPSDITNAGFICVVTANAEQTPRICTVTGLSRSSGLEISFLFFGENKGSAFFSFTSSTTAASVPVSYTHLGAHETP